MIFYLSLWALPAFFTLSPVEASRNLQRIIFCAIGAVLALVIGLRDQIGADWYNYLKIYEFVNNSSFLASLIITDPAYAVLNMIGERTDLGIYFVNMVCASIFMTGVTRLVLAQPLPGLALCIAIPYFIIVVAMGYTRQSAAMGLVMMAYVYLARQEPRRAVVMIVLAALFHRSAIIALPLAFQSSAGISKKQLFLLVGVLAGIAVTLLAEVILSQVDMYVTNQTQKSEGGAVRVALNMVPALILLLNHHKWRQYWPKDYQILKWISLAALGIAPLVSFASTAADRIGLYIGILQIVVLARFPLLLNGHWRVAALLGVLGFYGAMLTAWLLFSQFADCCWTPYRSALF